MAEHQIACSACNVAQPLPAGRPDAAVAAMRAFFVAHATCLTGLDCRPETSLRRCRSGR